MNNNKNDDGSDLTATYIANNYNNYNNNYTKQYNAMMMIMIFILPLQLTFRLFSQSTWPLDISLSSTFRPMSMVLLFLNYFLPQRLIICLMNFISVCLPADSHRS